MFTRSNSAGGPAYGPAAAQLLEFGPKGEFIREIGKGNYGWSFAHTVRIDREDNIWAVDKGSDLVIKFSPDGRIREVYGRRKESSESEGPWEHPNPPLPHVNGLFRQPTDIAWDSQGNAYISDGYINSRVAKYTRKGDWVKSWGEKGSGPGQFNTPHAIAIDSNDRVYVGDRGNRRIQVFDKDGTFIRQFTIDVPAAGGAGAREREHADRGRAGQCDRRAEFGVHHARIEPGDVRRRDCVSGPHLQGEPRRQGPGRHRRLRASAEAVRRPPSDRLPVRARNLRRGDVQLAGAEGGVQAVTARCKEMDASKLA